MRQSAHPVYMAMIVKICAVATIIRRATLKLENGELNDELNFRPAASIWFRFVLLHQVYATRVGEEKLAQSPANRATMASIAKSSVLM